MASACKRRKVDRENRIFKESWTDQYFFILHGKMALCLLCSICVAVVKECNLKRRHYLTKHSEKFNSLTGDARKNKIESLRKSLTEQQGTFIGHRTESDNNTRASFAVSELIGKRMKPFTNGEFVKDSL